jgi:hypothetical protein
LEFEISASLNTCSEFSSFSLLVSTSAFGISTEVSRFCFGIWDLRFGISTIEYPLFLK